MLLLCSFFRLKELFQVTNALTTSLLFFLNMAIPIKCFASHHFPSREGESVGRAKKKKNEHMIAY